MSGASRETSRGILCAMRPTQGTARSIMGWKTSFYGLKVVRLAIIYIASTMAVRMQEAKYVEEVYGRGGDPPSLLGFLFTLVAFMLVFDALLLAGAKALGGMDVEVFNDKRFISMIQTESFVYTVFVLGAGYFVTRIVARKKYINYRVDGMRALRAMREMLMATIVPISVTPIFVRT